MRRPPDKDGQPVSDRDVDTSNATLHTLFGARQKSWMVGAGAPVRPTPRTSVLRTSSTSQVALAQKATAPTLPSPTPSAEPSPVLSHTTVNGIQIEGRKQQQDTPRSSTTITPSNQAPQPHLNEADTQLPRDTYSQTSQERSLPVSISPLIPNTGPFTTSQGHVESPSTMADNIPPLPPSVLLPSDRDHEEQPLARPYSPPDLPRTSPYLNNQGLPHTQSLPARPGPMPSLNQGPQTVRPQMPAQEVHSRPHQQQIQSPMQPNFPSPQMIPGSSSTAVMSEAGPHPLPSDVPANPRKRQRIQVPAMPSLKGRIPLIEQHIQKAGGLLNLNTGLERPRFQLLKDACNREDLFYVALHQIFCCWDVDRNQILNIPEYPDPQALQVAFKILSQLIRENDALAPNHKRWFAEFPSPLRHLLQSSEPYRKTVGEVGMFLGKLASDWGLLSSECTARGYPPLVDELVIRMCLLSPILQGVIFTASRRNLGIRDEEVGHRMEDMFKRDQREHRALAARYNTARPPTAREAQERNRALASEYIYLHNQLIQQRRSSASVASRSRVPTPTVPSNDYNHSTPTNSSPVPRVQQTINQGTWNQNQQTPVPPAIQQFPPNSVPARMQPPGDGPSNQLIGGTRPPSVGAQRAYTNTPSPTLLQGLSMHSPVQQNFPSPAVRSNAPMPQQNGSPRLGVQPNGTYYQSPLQQQVNPASLPTQIAQQQQMAAQFQHQNNQNWAQNSHIRQPHVASMQQVAQQQQLQQQQHMQQDLSRQVLNMNRAAQSRRDTPRNNSIMSNGHRPQGTHAIAGLQGQLSAAVQAELYSYNHKSALQRSLIPPLHYVHPQQAQNADVTALHQAHMRSPRLVAADLPPSSMAQDNAATRYYQSVRGFVLSPTRISSSSPLSRFDFTVSLDDLALTPKDVTHSNGQVATREFRQGTLQYRLRCVQARRTDTKYTIADWVVADTVWPESASLAINKIQLDIRRKNHHGKDLPIDITPYIKSSTPNSTIQVDMSILKGRTKMKEFSYFLAVEVIEILHHNQVLDMVYQNRISANHTLNKIKRSLAGPIGDDDDIAMVVSDLSIDLADPFTSKVFEVPVRGSSCLHRECFDLEVYLMTRTSKPKRPEQPCMVDVWKCPLCGKDARPYSLQIDDFLGSVRASLQKQGKLDDVKAILINGDGQWRPKVEKRKATTGPEDSDYSSDGDGALRRDTSVSSKPAGPKKAVEVISLDD